MAATHAISDSGSSDEEGEGTGLPSADQSRRSNAHSQSEATDQTTTYSRPVERETGAQSIARKIPTKSTPLKDEASTKQTSTKQTSSKRESSTKAKTPTKDETSPKRSASTKRVSTFSIAKFIDDVSSSDEEEEEGWKTKRMKFEKRNHSSGHKEAASSSEVKEETSSKASVKADLSDEEATDIDDEMVAKLEARRWKKQEKQNGGSEDEKANASLSQSHAVSDSDDDVARKTCSKDTPRKEMKKSKNSPNSSQTSKTPSKSPKSPSLFSPSPSSKNVSKSSSTPSPNPSPTSSSRPPCRYGLTCYRQKQSHWNKVSHSDEVCEVGKGGKTVWTRPKLASSSQKNSSLGDDDFDDDDDDMISTLADDDDDLGIIGGSSSSWSSPRLIQVLSEAEPHNYFLTKVSGIDDSFNAYHALTMKDILSPLLGTLESSVQFNYCIDIDWMMSQYPPQFRRLPVLVVHGLSREAKAELIAQASQYSPHVRLAQARLPDPFGTHHTKMMILKYAEGLRVAITTANLIAHDWHQKTQGYIRAYRLNELKTAEDMILSHDMSSCRVFLLGSVPGRHQGAERFKWGHMRLRRILEEHQKAAPSKGAKGTPTLNLAKSDDEGVGKSWYLLAQFSSVGSLGNSASQWLQAEFAASLSSINPRPGASTSSKGGLNPLVSADAVSSKFRLVFPCVDDVANSLEGYQAGASIPYARATAAKQPWLKAFMHKWRADGRGRTRAAPHIKSFAQIDPTQSKAAWFVSTSANLSKAAWGALEKNQSQLFIRSYELGVVFLPKYFADVNDPAHFDIVKGTNKTTSDGRRLAFPVDFPLTPYGQTDEPWLWDVNHTKRLDSHGCTWEPNK